VQFEEIIGRGQELGFRLELRYFEKLDFGEQVRLISCAHVFICPHGAAATHVLFMKPRALLVELYPSETRSIPYYTHGNNFGPYYIQEGLDMHTPDLTINIYGNLAKLVSVRHLRILGLYLNPQFKSTTYSDFRMFDIDNINITSLFRAIQVSLKIIDKSCSVSVPIKLLVHNDTNPEYFGCERT
jgi:hypothetical protein